MSNFTYCEDTFSDLHKDARGYRPRGHEFYTATPERKQEIWDSMLVELEDEIERERREQLANQHALEERIAATIELGARDREQALLWICEAEGIDKYDAAYGGSYFCYHFGLTYRLQEMFEGVARTILEQEGNPYEEAA